MAKKIRAASLALIAGTALFTIGGMAAHASAGIVTQYGSGEAVPLSNLAGTANTLLVGDKLFSDFTYSTTGSDMPAASDVTITGETIGTGSSEQWGFNIAGDFMDTDTPNASDAKLGYTVTVVNPAVYLISGVAIDGNPHVMGTGNVVVTETWTPDVGNQKVFVDDVEPGGSPQMQDSITLDTPAASLAVTKDILASVPNAAISSGIFDGPLITDGVVGDVASITSIDELYSQTPTSGSGVPEPASLGLLAVGGLGLLARRRR